MLQLTMPCNVMNRIMTKPCFVNVKQCFLTFIPGLEPWIFER